MLFTAEFIHTLQFKLAEKLTDTCATYLFNLCICSENFKFNEREIVCQMFRVKRVLLVLFGFSHGKVAFYNVYHGIQCKKQSGKQN